MPELLIVVLLSECTELVSIYFNVDLLDDLLKDLVINVGEVPNQLLEGDAVVVLLKEPDNIGLSPSLDEMLVLP